MSRPFLILLAALALAAPTPGSAQSTTERTRERAEAERERARERAEAERERAQELAEAERERAQERAERARERAEQERERAQERAERDRERREREGAGVLDTVVAFDARGTVSVNCAGGDIVIVGSDRNEIRVKARTERGAIRFISSGANATLEPESSRSCSDARFEVTVPAGVRLSASTWSGSLEIRGVRGDLEANSQSGDVVVRDAGDHLEVTTLSGNISVRGVRGDAKLGTVSGDVTLNTVGGIVEVETVSGDVTLGEVASRQVRTSSTSGDVSYAGVIVAGGRYEFSSHSGDVHLQLPADVGAQLSLSTFSGGVESAFPITLKAGEHGIGAAQAKRLNFSLGQGTARISAETFSGDVTITSTGRRQ